MNTIQLPAKFVVPGHVLDYGVIKVEVAKVEQTASDFSIHIMGHPGTLKPFGIWLRPDDLAPVQDTPLTPAQAAQSLGINAATVITRHSMGDLKSDPGSPGDLRFTVSEVERYRATLATPGGPR